ncbi:hypothetical protein EV197_0416 [Aquimarina brevivitae]|uniref:Uncharacterized protein n=1 Tax=Aquimarina brevivitae TaxID=323412 RepID=A0A4Q7PGD6_9FLAO|nr:hypothetical protein EV197_0416 [Aquimarina brevivitae]
MFFFKLCIGVVAYSQVNNPVCMENLSLFTQHAKVKNYEAAFTPWRQVRTTCPDIHIATYVYGERILQHKIKTSGGSLKKNYITELVGLYNDANKYFPKKYTLASTATDKAILLYDNSSADTQSIYKILDQAFKKDLAGFNNPKGLYLYIASAIDLYRNRQKSLQEILDIYDQVMDKIDHEKQKQLTIIDPLLSKEQNGILNRREQRDLKQARAKKSNYNKVEASMEGKLGSIADCNKLMQLYSQNLESKKNDPEWLVRAATWLYKKECTNTALFDQVVMPLQYYPPTANSVFYLGLLYHKKNNPTNALNYYQKAIRDANNNYDRAQIALAIANQYKNLNQLENSRNFAQIALSYQPSLGKAYLLIANLYARSANACGDSTFAKRAVYWLASKTAALAKQVDPGLQNEAIKASRSYSSRAPSKEEVTQSGMTGKTIHFSCWINGSIRVPD